MASICFAEAEWRLRGGPRRSKSALGVSSVPVPLLATAAEDGVTVQLPVPVPVPVPTVFSALPLLSLGSSLDAEMRSNIGREPRRALGSREATAVAADSFGFEAAALVEVLGDRREVALLLLLLLVPVLSSRIEDTHPASLLL